jgi:hypothetical protein
VVGDERRQADPEVHVEAVVELLGGARRHFVMRPGHRQAPVLSAALAIASIASRAAAAGARLRPRRRRGAQGPLLDPLLGMRVEHDPVHVDARQMHGVGVDAPVSTISSTSTIVILPAIAAPG